MRYFCLVLGSVFIAEDRKGIDAFGDGLALSKQNDARRCCQRPHEPELAKNTYKMGKEDKEKKAKKNKDKPEDNADAMDVEPTPKKEKKEKSRESLAGEGEEGDGPSYESRLKALSPIAQPLASKKLTKKLLKVVKKGGVALERRWFGEQQQPYTFRFHSQLPNQRRSSVESKRLLRAFAKDPKGELQGGRAARSVSGLLKVCHFTGLSSSRVISPPSTCLLMFLFFVRRQTCHTVMSHRRRTWVRRVRPRDRRAASW